MPRADPLSTSSSSRHSHGDLSGSRQHLWSSWQASSLIPIRFSFSRQKRCSAGAVASDFNMSSTQGRRRRHKSISFLEPSRHSSVAISDKAPIPLLLSPECGMGSRSLWPDLSSASFEPSTEESYDKHASSSMASTPRLSLFSSTESLSTAPSTPDSVPRHTNPQNLATLIVTNSPDLDCPCSPQGESHDVECIYDDYLREDDQATVQGSIQGMKEEKDIQHSAVSDEPLSPSSRLVSVTPANMILGSSSFAKDLGSLPEHDFVYDDLLLDPVQEATYLQANECRVCKAAPVLLDTCRKRVVQDNCHTKITSDGRCSSLDSTFRNKSARIARESRRLGLKQRATLRDGMVIIRPPTPPKSPKLPLYHSLQTSKRQNMEVAFHRRLSQPPPIPRLRCTTDFFKPVERDTPLRKSLPYVLELLQGCIKELPFLAFDPESRIIPLLKLLLSGDLDSNVDTFVANFGRTYTFITAIQRSSDTPTTFQSFESSIASPARQLQRHHDLFEQASESLAALKILRLAFPTASNQVLSVLYTHGLALQWIKSITTSSTPVKVRPESPSSASSTLRGSQQIGAYYRDLRPQAIEIQKELQDSAKRWLGVAGIGKKCGDDGHLQLFEGIIEMIEGNQSSFI